ncbi:Cys-tRNA(Pro)/Cys-tRNA(Cys) deacylase [Kytococcus aerolatus]|uniref:Cys-tRNA(Pro)/Cys-tRNA(Cys) deacylase n=1 Tax=Kytococcus aerolatus TaxID=592308 RepID=A0A212T1S7_9MICO|nr:aminoacyl-tRNA deacylase [Kytococcus aerolatus]SNC59987.1 Cys-tRNA(Pro)/Cys-tRNA(Cys) deacylase [Kytococcus aerolatus]
MRIPTTPATRALDAAGVPWTGHAFGHEDDVEGYGEEASEALGIEPERIFKTLVVDTGGRRQSSLAVGVVAVADRLDTKAVARELGVKRVSMADVALAERATGYVVGGISPFGQRTRLPMLVDRRLEEHATVFLSGGRRGFDVEITPAAFLEATGARMVDIRA